MVGQGWLQSQFGGRLMVQRFLQCCKVHSGSGSRWVRLQQKVWNQNRQRAELKSSSKYALRVMTRLCRAVRESKEDAARGTLKLLFVGSKFVAESWFITFEE